MITLTFLVLTASADPTDATKTPKEYVAKLTAAEPTADAQFRLGSWARKEGMKDVADGHLRAAVSIDPRYEAAQKALGRILRDGRWETKEERKARLDTEERLKTELVAWQRKIKDVGLDAVSGRPLSDAAISAIEQFAANDADRSMAAIRLFGDCNRGASTVALVRQAIASQFPKVRVAAAKSLLDRNPDHYLTAILEYARPQRSGRGMLLGSGEIWYWQDGSTLTVAKPKTPAMTKAKYLAEGFPSDTIVLVALGDFAPSYTTWAFIPSRDHASEVEKHFTDTENHRTNAVAALQSITGKKIGDDFSAWRGAVMQFTDAYIDQRAPEPVATTTTYYQPEPTSNGTFIRLQSCFAPGTPVVAKRGLTPIEKICVGELVLSRNVETGETVYKPVIGRTLRPRVAMRSIDVGEEKFIATLGHPFWAPEQGWVKVKNLTAETTLGTENGTVRLTKIEEVAEPAQAYNLVVADFGTYFVGKSRVLVHDNSPIRDAPAKASK